MFRYKQLKHLFVTVTEILICDVRWTKMDT